MEGVKAIIFDMDGVLIDSEPLWRKAMIRGFNEAGVQFTEDDCRKTTGMRFKEVVSHWVRHHSITSHSHEQIHGNVIAYLIEMINSEGKPMPGVNEGLSFFIEKGYKIGLATSSNTVLVETILNKLNSRNYFSAITSAEFLQYGKPHPEVFLKCAASLSVKPENCLVVEDSVNGVISAKAAQMKVVAIPDAEHKTDQRFVIADHRLDSMHDLIKLF
jgi:mannitol-1-/sugar-/sorbitol-6-/2-deoxyglucose-6-phosphatase